MKSLLATRKLGSAHREILMAAGWRVTDYDAIAITLLPTPYDPKGDAAIFSSKHAVLACFPEDMPEAPSDKPCLCVGETTAALLGEKGVRVLETAPSASDLATRIEKRYRDWSFTYYCGNRRLDTLPQALDSLGIPWEEVVVYNTGSVHRAFDQAFDGLLFFSPSGVESYARMNPFGKAVAYCIGPTTAAAARKYTERILISETPDVGAVIALALSQKDPVK
ncbi:uroporphyrinogen-III synthase [Robiginitalea marina]|uniref:Uroporphyrinogen-III synthase n=1 Tax=Robiginitalea marina TaxID=2954105 RepID=A0ABT1AWC4_9FLAO|nr:uroporphyrinogen-III synthase [Robiginitalea marina]MCO5724307.1 uroporphyrinogen-III synthase [Robiginitalea marina]